MVDNVHPLLSIDRHFSDPGMPKRIDFRLILDFELMAKKRRLQP